MVQYQASMAQTSEAQYHMTHSSEAQQPDYFPIENQQHIGYPVTVDGQPCYVYLPPAPPRRRFRARSVSCWPCVLLLLTLVAVSGFFFWPRQLQIGITHFSLGKIHFNVKRGDSIIPKVLLDLTLNLRVKVDDPNYFGVKYESVTVGISYDGVQVGEVQSSGGKVHARSTSYVNATLEVSGYEISNNVLSLLEDLADGALPLQTVTNFDGRIKILWFELPLEGNVSCDIVVDPQEQTILTQDCDL